MDRKLQRHRADSLRQHGFLVVYTWAYLFRDVNFTSLTMLLLFVNVKHFDLKFAWTWRGILYVTLHKKRLQAQHSLLKTQCSRPDASGRLC